MSGRPQMLFVTNLHFNKNGNGGQQRTFHIIKELSKYSELYIVSPYHGNEAILKNISAKFILSKRSAKRAFFHRNLLLRQVLKILNFYISILIPKYNKTVHCEPFMSFVLSKQLTDLYNQNDKLDTIVFDTLSTVVPLNKNSFKEKILNAHNVDSEIAKHNFETKIKENHAQHILNEASKHQKLLELYECNIDKFFTEIWVCSNEDKKKFKDLNIETQVRFYNLPNGSDTNERQLQAFNSNNYHKFLFVGSLNYKPNYRGLEWFVNNIFIHLSQHFQLDIVGRSAHINNFKYVEKFTNINLIGEVEDIEKIYQKYDSFIVPLLDGSGTRLKILEAMSYGKLIISTAKGIEGINAKKNVEYLEFSTLNDFKELLNKLHDYKKLEKIRIQARNLIDNHYSWRGVVKKYVEEKYGK